MYLLACIFTHVGQREHSTLVREVRTMASACVFCGIAHTIVSDKSEI